MQLGAISSGVVRVFRVFRGSEVIKDKKGQCRIERARKGGVCFVFEIDYNKNMLRFVAAITKEDEIFDQERGKAELAARIQLSETQPHLSMIYQIPLGEGPVLDQVYTALETISNNGGFKNGEQRFLQTLYRRLELLSRRNASAEDLMDQISAGDF